MYTYLPEWLACEVDWVMIRSLCLKVNPDLEDFDTAELSCVNQGSHLASIHSQEEQNLLETFLLCVFCIYN